MKNIMYVIAKGLKQYKANLIPELNRFQLAKIKQVIDVLDSLKYESNISINDCEMEIEKVSLEIGLDIEITRCAIARLWLSCFEGYSSNTIHHLQNRDWESFLYENGGLLLKLPKSDICNSLIKEPILKCEIVPYCGYNKWIFFEIRNSFDEN